MSEPEARRPPLPEAWLIAIPAVAAGVADVFVVRDGGRPWPVAIAAGTFMAVFVAGMLRWWRRSLRRYREAKAARLEGTAPGGGGGSAGLPAAGGWANPTSAQRAANRWRRVITRPGRTIRSNPLAGDGVPFWRRRR